MLAVMGMKAKSIDAKYVVANDFNPKTVSTSGKDANGDPVEMTITGSNFGTNANEEIKVIFKTLTESPNLEFIVQVKLTVFY